MAFWPISDLIASFSSPRAIRSLRGTGGKDRQVLASAGRTRRYQKTARVAFRPLGRLRRKAERGANRIRVDVLVEKIRVPL